MIVSDRSNERWSLDFVSDAFTDDCRLRVLAVGDVYTPECLAPVGRYLAIQPARDSASDRRLDRMLRRHPFGNHFGAARPGFISVLSRRRR